jgi:hypothetical protein
MSKVLENKWIEIFAIFLLMSLIINLNQSDYSFDYFYNSRKKLLLISVYYLVILLLFIFFCIKIYRKTSLLIKLCRLFFFQLHIPQGAKIAIALVFIGNALSIIFAKPVYPFYDVGMFRWNTPFKDQNEIVYKPKYYYFKDGIPKIIDLRKESFYFLSDNLGLGFTHEFTFATAYHNKAQKENFNYLASEFKKRGIDTIWVGVHAVNYKTKKVWFDPDICNAITINKNKNLHYGPIYIPGYQIEQCHAK